MLVLRHGLVCWTTPCRISLRVHRRCFTVPHAALRDRGKSNEGDSRLHKTDSSGVHTADDAAQHAEKISKFGDIRLGQYGKVIEDDYAIFRDQYRKCYRREAFRRL